MRRFLTAIATLTALAGSGSASADPVCDDLWFSRNIVFHEAGYCFGSALGQTVFGNARCIGQDIDLHADMKARVEEIRQREADWGCAVDTSRTRLDLPQIAQRMALTDQPLRTEGESACIGWKRPPLALWSGFRRDAYEVAQIKAGDMLLFSHDDWQDWSFVQLFRDDRLTAMGWVRLGPHDPEMCEGWAG